MVTLQDPLFGLSTNYASHAVVVVINEKWSQMDLIDYHSGWAFALRSDAGQHAAPLMCLSYITLGGVGAGAKFFLCGHAPD